MASVVQAVGVYKAHHRQMNAHHNLFHHTHTFIKLTLPIDMASRWYPEGTTYPTLAPIYYAQGQQSLNSSSRDSSRQAGVPMSMTHARIYGHPKLYIHPTNAAPQKLIPRNGALVSDQEPEFTDGVDYFKVAPTCHL